jgi:hypothetical protein
VTSNNLNLLITRTDIVYHKFFQDLEKAKKEQFNLGNTARAEELNTKALMILTQLREAGVSTIKLQSYYQYFL